MEEREGRIDIMVQRKQIWREREKRSEGEREKWSEGERNGGRGLAKDVW